MTRLPRVTGKELIQALQRAGFRVDRVVGSHHVLTFPGDPIRTAIVPYRTKVLKLGTLRSALRQARLTPEDLRKLL